MNTSVIIPTYNEPHIDSLIEHVRQRLGSQVEILVVDRSPNNKTRLSAEQTGVLVFTAPQAGRAHQMNFGVKHATNKLLLFLHADTFLPEYADTFLNKVANSPNIYYGGFYKQFDNTSTLLYSIAWLGNIRLRFSRRILGDNAFFIKKDIFEKYGGFPKITLMEDLAFSHILRTQIPYTHFSYSTNPVTTSARRFTNGGTLKTLARMTWLQLLYFIGVSPERIKKWYK